MVQKLVVILLVSMMAVISVGQISSAEESETRSYVKAYYPTKKVARTIIGTFEPAPPEVNYQEGYLVIHVTTDDRVYLEGLGFTLKPYPGYNLHHQREGSSTTNVRSIPGYSCYETVEETFTKAIAITTNYPALATLVDAGNSWEKENGNGGYDMWVLKLTSSSTSGTKPKLFVTSAIHAREYTTAPVSLAFATYLVENYQSDADARWILDYNEVHLMFHANPDGRKKAETGTLWRKNTNTNYCSNNQPGADLNRNFDFEWGGAGASTNTCSETYRGAYGGSEPETQAVQNYLKAIFDDHNGSSPNVAVDEDASGLYIDLHSYSELVLWPIGYSTATAPNGDQLQTLGRKFAYFNNYEPMKASGLYPASGTTDDYAYGELGIAAYCFELGTAFFQSCSTYNNTILPDNLQALIYAAKVARAPYMFPAGPDAISVAVDSNNTLTATITDRRYNNTNGSESTQNITSAEYYIDTPPWAQGTAQVMDAEDGTFNNRQEDVEADIDTSSLTVGEHTIYVRGKDADNNWGAVSAVFITVQNQNKAPTADFDTSLNQLTVTFTDKSSDTDGTVVSHKWDFGDGTNSTQQNPVHSYASAGTYTVVLTVRDNDGLTGTVSKPITVKTQDKPVAGFTTSIAQLTVTFADTSSDSDGTVQSRSWDFGDGNTSVSKDPVHNYSTPGTYIVTLTVTDNDGLTGTTSKSISVKTEEEPVAAFDESSARLTATFTDTSSDADGTIQSWSWNFGDGTTSSQQHPVHSYTASGTYNVTLTVTDNDGLTGTLTKAILIQDLNEPVATFTFSKTALTVTFTDTSTDMDGTIQSWNWTFGDGNSATEQHPVHTYSTAGNYTITLTITDNDGLTGTLSKTVTISPQDGPVADFSFFKSNLTVSFTDKSSDSTGTIQSRRWQFGDGKESTQSNPLHTYSGTGSYTVTLSVSNDNGKTSQMSSPVIVSSIGNNDDEDNGCFINSVK